MSISEEQQADHLLLLLGKNPLPNAVAGELLVKQGGSITMLYTADTAPAVKNLGGFLKGRQFNEPVKVDEADACSIFQGVFNALNAVGVQSVGLHYTGGTKAMSVHAYRAVELWRSQREQSCEPIFSYLDARSLSVVFDPLDPLSQTGVVVPVGDFVKLSLKELIRLHGWSFKKKHGKEMLPLSKALLSESAQALAQLYATAAGMNAWRDWKSCELNKCRTNGEWDNDKINRATLCLSNDPLLAVVNNMLRTELSLTGDSIPLATIPPNFPGGKELCEWLDGKWLEHHVLACLNKLKQPPNQLGLHDCCNSVRTEEVDFEVDVIALRGYQLFAFSCGAGSKKELKLKLFEASVRARQLGGDEARVALVCPADKKLVDKLLYEMSRDIEPDSRIQVFGQDDFSDLKTAIGDWIKEQSL